MTKKQFDDLSEEIKGMVVERVLRPTDLINVCLVNKQLHALSVKPLYRTVQLDLGSSRDSRLPALLSPNNIGLKHIRALWLYLAGTRHSCGGPQQAQVMCRMLLELLPEDIMEEFRCDVPELQEFDWCPWSALNAENVLLLYKKQRKLKWLEAMDLDRDILPDLQKDERLQRSMFASARKLALYPENRTTLQLGEFLVTNLKGALEDLIVHCNFSFPEDDDDHSPTRSDISSRELSDTANAPGLLMSTLFSSFKPFEECEPFQNLTKLEMHQVGLRFCADTWCKFIDFHKLKELRVLFCPAADTLLGQLSKATHLPTHLKVLKLHHRDNDEEEALTALNGLLCLVNGLEELEIDLGNAKSLPSADYIVYQKATLESLYVHCVRGVSETSRATSSPDRSDELIYASVDFEKICKACTSLSQLSCAWPTTSLLRTPSSTWLSFETACGDLHNLVTLHIDTWPGSTSDKLPRPAYEQLLQGLAQRTFEATKRLRVVAFGVHDSVFDRRESQNMICYLRSSCIDAEGRSKVFAAPLSWNLRKFIEPCSTVLNVSSDIRVHVEPPVRSIDRGGWGDDDDDI